MILMFLWCCVLIFSTAVGLPEVSRRGEPQKEDAGKKFAGLLKELIVVNERRLKAMKLLSRLQDYNNIYNNELRSRLNREEFMHHLRNREHMELTEDHQMQDEDNSNKILVLIKKAKGPENRNPTSNTINEDLEAYRSALLASLSLRSKCSLGESGESAPASRSFKETMKKKGANICVQACTEALTDACNEYNCYGYVKKYIKSGCKEYCKSEFSKWKYINK